MSNIESKLNKVFEYVESYADANGFPPTVREICAHLSIKSTATCHYYLQKLEERGLIIKSASKKRAMGIAESAKKERNYLNVPVIGTVTAGTPVFAVENFEEFCPVPVEFGEENELFMLKVRGTSMINAGIFNGDKIIVKKQPNADNGDIVVAYFDESATVKRFYKYPDHIVLHPENETMSDIILSDVSILGKVIGLLRKF